VLTVVDAMRYSLLFQMMYPLLKEQIASADILIINKTGELHQDTLLDISGSICSINPGACIRTEKDADFRLMLGELFWEH
jgi:G3E family GTPase